MVIKNTLYIGLTAVSIFILSCAVSDSPPSNQPTAGPKPSDSETLAFIQEYLPEQDGQEQVYSNTSRSFYEGWRGWMRCARVLESDTSPEETYVFFWRGGVDPQAPTTNQDAFTSQCAFQGY